MNLANPKHELFAKALARNASYNEAARQAGFTGLNDTQAKNLAKEPKIVKRVRELMDEQERSLSETEDDLKEMPPEQVRKLIDENWIIKELVVSIKMSQTASQFNATKALLELLGKEIGMFGSQGPVEETKQITNDKSQTIVNILTNIKEFGDMTEQMVDVTPTRKIKTEVDVEAMRKASEVVEEDK